MIEVDKQPGIIFIMGIMPRSGTHFLANLLCQHPDCKKSVIAEDSLLAASRYLTGYTAALHHAWQVQGELPAIETKKLLLNNIGDGLVNFLRQSRNEVLNKKGSTSQLLPADEPRYLVTKTPQVINLNNFFELFPDQKLLILVRDGRALTESLHLSFQEPYETAMKDWAAAANTIIDFEQQWNSKRPYLIAKYEDLHAHTEQELRKILEFLNLDAGKYNFQSAENLPVTGSSLFKRGDGAVHWMPVRKTEEFNPLARAAGWPRARHERFNWIAEKQLLYFGYQPQTFSGKQTYWVLRNRLLDAKAKLLNGLFKIAKRPVTRKKINN